MQKVSTRDKIIDNAFKLFYEKGFNGTSIDEILKEAKLHKGSLYYIFKNKKEVLLAVIKEKIARNLRDKYSGLDTTEKPLLFLEEKLLDIASFDFKHGCALNNLVQELSPVDEEIAKALQVVYLELEAYYFMALRDLKVPKEEKKALSKMMVATVEGAIMAAKSAQKKEPYLEIVTQMFKML